MKQIIETLKKVLNEVNRKLTNDEQIERAAYEDGEIEF